MVSANKFQVPPGFGPRYIVVEISETETKIEAFGFEGKGCHAATKPYEDALGGKVVEAKEKAATNKVKA